MSICILWSSLNCNLIEFDFIENELNVILPLMFLRHEKDNVKFYLKSNNQVVPSVDDMFHC